MALPILTRIIMDYSVFQHTPHIHLGADGMDRILAAGVTAVLNNRRGLNRINVFPDESSGHA